jgi:hypothetical protein
MYIDEGTNKLLKIKIKIKIKSKKIEVLQPSFTIT